MNPIKVEILNKCTGMGCISPDSWFQFFSTLIGTALGAFLGGYGAYLIYKKQKNDSKDIIKINFKKIFRKKGSWIAYVNFTIEHFLDIYDDVELNLIGVDPIKVTITKARDALLEIPDEKIPDEIFDDVFKLQEELETLRTLVVFYEENKLHGVIVKYSKEDFEKSLREINRLFDNIKAF